MQILAIHQTKLCKEAYIASFPVLSLSFNKAVGFYTQFMLYMPSFQLLYQKESCKTSLMELGSLPQHIVFTETPGRNLVFYSSANAKIMFFSYLVPNPITSQLCYVVA